MNKASRSVNTEIPVRPGEGFELVSERRQTVETDGKSSLAFSFRLADAPAPDRRYVTDVYSVHPSVEGCKFLFAQEKIGGGLRSLLVIHLSDEAVYRFVESTGTVSNWSISGSTNAADAPIRIEQEPDQTVAFRANAVAVAVANGESCMDFYQMSAFSLHAVQNGGKLQMTQLVRVEMRTGQFFGLLRDLERLGFKPKAHKVMS